MTESANAESRRMWEARGAAWRQAAAGRARQRSHHDRRLIEAARIGAGGRVLDLASGPGDPAMAEAETVGETGLVVASDLSVEMLTGAVERAASLGQANMAFAVTDMEALPFGDGEFNAVTSRFGIMFPADAVRAAREALRVLKPGGRAAYLVHGPHDAQTGFAATQDTVRDFLSRGPTDPSGARYRFAVPGSLSQVLSDAGFANVEETEHHDVAEVAVTERPWQANLSRTLGPRLEAMPAERRQALDDALEAAFETLRDGDIYRMETLVRLVAGTKPP